MEQNNILKKYLEYYISKKEEFSLAEIAKMFSINFDILVSYVIQYNNLIEKFDIKDGFRAEHISDETSGRDHYIFFTKPLNLDIKEVVLDKYSKSQDIGQLHDQLGETVQLKGAIDFEYEFIFYVHKNEFINARDRLISMQHAVLYSEDRRGNNKKTRIVKPASIDFEDVLREDENDYYPIRVHFS